MVMSMNDAIDQNPYDTSPFRSALRPNLYGGEGRSICVIRLKPSITTPSINAIVRYTVTLGHHRNTDTVSTAFRYKGSDTVGGRIVR